MPLAPPLQRRATVAAALAAAVVVLGLVATAPSLGAETSGQGQLTVKPQPAVATQIVVDGLARNGTQLSALPLEAGEHRVCFSTVAGYLSPPCEHVLIEAGTTTVIQPTFVPSGQLRVITDPHQSTAGISVDGVPRDEGGVLIPLDAGTHEVCFEDVTGMQTPPCRTVEVLAGAEARIVGVYSTVPTPTRQPATTLVGTADRGSGNQPWSATVTVTVTDDVGVPLDGMTATGSWLTSRPAGVTTGSCVTASDGTCTLVARDMATGGGNRADFTLTGLVDPAAEAQDHAGHRSITIDRNGATAAS